ncbi:TetR/AcrR family transcriptional regulator [Chloroflexia bacterium SDU3-3]|nr:TetR/AcrR family transcriptional regulator [Chloroflexia bacterium SDU3-3]
MDNRSLLMQCALRLFAARGYDAIGVQEIAEAAKVTKPTLYHYFKSKRGVLEALVAEGFQPFLHDLAEAARFEGDLPHSMYRVITTFFAFARREPLLYRMQLAMWFVLPESEAHQVISSITQQQQQILEQLFLESAERHGNMRGRHRIYSATFLGVINTYIGISLNHSMELNDEAVHRLIQQFSHGIYS